jgi:hypothetical protein
MGAGPDFVDKYQMSSLRLLGSVGEPINPEAWLWYHKHVGKERCEIVDTWWQTETGGILISPLPGATATKPGSATKPLPGVQPIVLSPEGKLQEQTKAEGVLCIKDSWPGQMRTSMATTAASFRPISRPTRATTSPAMAAGATRTAITGSPAASMTCSTFPAIASAPPRSKARWSPTRKSPRPPSSAIRTTSRGRASTATSP